MNICIISVTITSIKSDDSVIEGRMMNMTQSNNKSPYTTKEKVHNRAKESIGKPMHELYKSFGIFNTTKMLKHKSFAGDAFEAWMKIPKNSRAEADLPDAKVELKATPYKINKDGSKSAKERLVLNIINYVSEAKATFETSSFKEKDKTMELAFYNHNNNVSKLNWSFDETLLFTFPEKDLKIIKNDWETIHKYIIEGRAHELTEGATLYLAAATKGASSKTLRKQPFSKIKAKQRAYSLKSSYMTEILRNFVFGNETDPAIRKDKFKPGEVFNPIGKQSPEEFESLVSSSELNKESFQQIILNRINHFKGSNILDLLKKYEIKPGSKNINSRLIAKLLGMVGNSANNSEEIRKANISIKTIKINKSHKITQSMSFPSFEFSDLVKELPNTSNSHIEEAFENSALYKEISKTFILVVFEEQEDGSTILKGAKFWFMPSNDLNEMMHVWKNTIDVINNGVILKYSGNRVCNNLPKKSMSSVGHVRPHTSHTSYIKNSYSSHLPTPATWINRPNNDSKYDKSGEYMTKQGFWLNNDYILTQIQDIIN